MGIDRLKLIHDYSISGHSFLFIYFFLIFYTEKVAAEDLLFVIILMILYEGI